MSVEVAFQLLDKLHHFLYINVILLLPLRIPQAVPQHPGIPGIHCVGDLQRWHHWDSPDHFKVLYTRLGVAISPQRHQPLETHLADFQLAETAVEVLLEPKFDNCGEIVRSVAAEKGQACEVLRKQARVFSIVADAGQPAAPHRLLRLVLLGENRFGLNL